MKAVRIVRVGQLVIDDVQLPRRANGESLVRVAAAGLNRADVLHLRGKYPPPTDAPAEIPGLEFSGAIDTPSENSRFQPGQRVCGLTGGGAQAQYIAIADSLLMPTPDNVSNEQAAGIPEAYITVHDALITQAHLQPGETLLVHAIASGIGIAAIQIAKLLGCRVFGTTRSAEKRERVRSLGADLVSLPDSFEHEVLAATSGHGVDVVLDPVGGAYFERNLNVLAERGRLILLATLSGSSTSLSLAMLITKRLTVIGTMLRPRTLSEKAAAVSAFAKDLLPKFANGELHVVIDRVFPLDRVVEAYDYMEQDKNIGKIVIAIS